LVLLATIDHSVGLWLWLLDRWRDVASSGVPGDNTHDH